MAQRPKIQFYVDIVSPFAYEAYYILRNDSLFKGCDVRYTPVFLGGLMKACGNTAPMFVKNKDKWIVAERQRWARLFSIPMKDENPPGFPPLTLTAMRALCVVEQLDGANGQSRFTRAADFLYDMLWVHHRPVQTPEVVREALESVLGKDEADYVMDKAGTEGKRLLAENTDKLFADGGFGLPWLTCTNTAGETESFWGVDHLGQVIQFLGLDKPQQGGWRSLL